MIGDEHAAANATGAIPVKPIANFKFDSMTVSSIPGQVEVDASVTVEDSRPNRSYLWSIAIKNTTLDHTFASGSYDHQVFSVLPGVVITPKFHDVFELQPGAYNIELRLYEVAPDMDVAELNQGSAVHPAVLLARNETVTVE